MTVRRVLSQSAEHVESGVVLASVDRETMAVKFGGHRMLIRVERGDHYMMFSLPAEPRWANGELVPAEIAGQLQAIIAEIGDFWGQESEFETVDFYVTD